QSILMRAPAVLGSTGNGAMLNSDEPRCEPIQVLSRQEVYYGRDGVCVVSFCDRASGRELASVSRTGSAQPLRSLPPIEPGIDLAGAALPAADGGTASLGGSKTVARE